MGRFYRTTPIIRPVDFAYQPPTSVAMSVLQRRDQVVERDIASSEGLGAPVTESLLNVSELYNPMDRQRATKILQGLEGEIDQIASDIQTDPTNHQQNQMRIAKARNKIRNSLTSGELAQMRNQQGDYLNWAQRQKAAGVDEKYIEGVSQMILDQWGGTNYNSPDDYNKIMDVLPEQLYDADPNKRASEYAPHMRRKGYYYQNEFENDLYERMALDPDLYQGIYQRLETGMLELPENMTKEKFADEYIRTAANKAAREYFVKKDLPKGDSKEIKRPGERPDYVDTIPEFGVLTEAKTANDKEIRRGISQVENEINANLTENIYRVLPDVTMDEINDILTLDMSSIVTSENQNEVLNLALNVFSSNVDKEILNAYKNSGLTDYQLEGIASMPKSKDVRSTWDLTKYDSETGKRVPYSEEEIKEMQNVLKTLINDEATWDQVRIRATSTLPEFNNTSLSALKSSGVLTPPMKKGSVPAKQQMAQFEAEMINEEFKKDWTEKNLSVQQDGNTMFVALPDGKPYRDNDGNQFTKTMVPEEYEYGSYKGFTMNPENATFTSSAIDGRAAIRVPVTYKNKSGAIFIPVGQKNYSGGGIASNLIGSKGIEYFVENKLSSIRSEQLPEGTEINVRNDVKLIKGRGEQLSLLVNNPEGGVEKITDIGTITQFLTILLKDESTPSK